METCGITLLHHSNTFMTLLPLTPIHAQLTALAGTWQTAGATSFALWKNGDVLASWPPDAATEEPDIIAPIQVNGRLFGELRVAGLTGPTAAARLTVDAEMLARFIALEDEMDLMTTEMIAYQDQLLAFYKLTQSTRGHLKLDETLQSLLSDAAQLVNAEAAFIVISPSIDGPRLVQHPRSILDMPAHQAFLQEIQTSGHEVLFNADEAHAVLPTDITNLFFVPIQIRGAIIAGGLGVVNHPGNGFQSPSVKMTRAIAEQAGAFIEKALLYQESIAQARFQAEMDVARLVQTRLLPQHPPHVDGLDIAAASRPALQVGGDFYDFVTQPGRPFIFMLGDVTGKGISAALLMTMTRTAIRSKASFMPKPLPTTIMSRSNEDLYDDFTEVGMFATVFIGQYAPTERHIQIANAGHAPVIYRPATGPAHLLEADGPPMGMLPMSLCELRTIPFGPGDLLVVATDGFSEATTIADEMFGYERLLQIVDTHAGLTATEIASALFNAIDCFTGEQPQHDDQTLVVIKGS